MGKQGTSFSSMYLYAVRNKNLYSLALPGTSLEVKSGFRPRMCHRLQRITSPICRGHHPLAPHHHSAPTTATLSRGSGPLCSPSYASPHLNCPALVCTSSWQHSRSLVLPGRGVNRKQGTTLPGLPVRLAAQQATSHIMFWFPVAADWVRLPLLPPVLWAKCAQVCLPRSKLHTAGIRHAAIRLLLVSRIGRLKVRKWDVSQMKLLIDNVIFWVNVFAVELPEHLRRLEQVLPLQLKSSFSCSFSSEIYTWVFIAFSCNFEKRYLCNEYLFIF